MAIRSTRSVSGPATPCAGPPHAGPGCSGPPTPPGCAARRQPGGVDDTPDPLQVDREPEPAGRSSQTTPTVSLGPNGTCTTRRAPARGRAERHRNRSGRARPASAPRRCRRPAAALVEGAAVAIAQTYTDSPAGIRHHPRRRNRAFIIARQDRAMIALDTPGCPRPLVAPPLRRTPPPPRRWRPTGAMSGSSPRS